MLRKHLYHVLLMSENFHSPVQRHNLHYASLEDQERRSRNGRYHLALALKQLFLRRQDYELKSGGGAVKFFHHKPKWDLRGNLGLHGAVTSSVHADLKDPLTADDGSHLARKLLG
jgi:hypothetical protein